MPYNPTAKTIRKSSLEDFVQKLLSSSLKESVVYYKLLPPKGPEWIPFNLNIHPTLEDLLKKININQLYTHQHKAINYLIEKKHTVISTPTASGKSLVYNIPTLNRLLTSPGSHAIYLFPLKALAQDQIRLLNKLLAPMGTDAPLTAVYDGDTSLAERNKIRRNVPNILFTNPEMLNLSLLPYHNTWHKLWSDLSYIVIDELHTYRGLFGSHMAWIFKRLKRIAQHYGSNPTFCMCSATIGNPSELASSLIGTRVHKITESGAAIPKRHIIFINPPDGNASKTAILLLKAAIYRGLKTIVYTESRKMSELIALWTQNSCPRYKNKISAYRAGFLPEERRKIETDLAEGNLLAVIATSALELGIDVGDIDLSILVGYPGTHMASWQRWGRAGRKKGAAVFVLIAQQDALDQYFMRHPSELIQGRPENAAINPWNKNIVSSHLLCAAKEIPLNCKEELIQHPQTEQHIQELTQKGLLLKSADGNLYYSRYKTPERDIDLRGSGNTYCIIDITTGEAIGTIDRIRAFKETHTGAVYIHAGKSFLIDLLDEKRKLILAKPQRVNYFTRHRSNKNTEILEITKSKNLTCSTVSLGRLKITEQVTGYEKRKIKGQVLLGITALDLPPLVFETEGFWLKIPTWIQDATIQKEMHFMGGIHAIEHAIIGTMPLLILADRNDFGGISIPYHPQTKSPAVFVYDGVDGGAGLSEAGFKIINRILNKTLENITSCPCQNGCPACVHSPKCGAGNRPIDKKAAVFILNALLTANPQKGRDGQDCILNHYKKDTSTVTSYIDNTCQNNMPVNLQDISFGVLDVETQRSAQEVGGWHKANLMRVSCCVLYHSKKDQFLVFMEENIDQLFEELKTLDIIIGFNIKRFDYSVLGAYTDIDLKILPTIDILEDIHSYLGYRLSLDHLAHITLNSNKGANGLMALKWWKEGKIQKIISYCRQDVALTRDLFLFGVRTGYLLFKNKAGNIVRIPVPWKEKYYKQ